MLGLFSPGVTFLPSKDLNETIHVLEAKHVLRALLDWSQRTWQFAELRPCYCDKGTAPNPLLPLQ